jgi:hypothetical protein
MATGTWAVVLRNTNLAVPSFKVFAHNLTHDTAIALENEIHQQRVEGERVTLVYIVDGLTPHQDSDPQDCDECDDLILAAHKLELAELEKDMARRGGRVLRDNQIE